MPDESRVTAAAEASFRTGCYHVGIMPKSVTGPAQPAVFVQNPSESEVTLKTYTAIYDHGRIVWDSADQPPEQRARVFITVVERLDGDDADVGGWHSLSVNGLAAAYGSDEPEYTAEDVRFR